MSLDITKRDSARSGRWRRVAVAGACALSALGIGAATAAEAGAAPSTTAKPASSSSVHPMYITWEYTYWQGHFDACIKEGPYMRNLYGADYYECRFAGYDSNGVQVDGLWVGWAHY